MADGADANTWGSAFAADVGLYVAAKEALNEAVCRGGSTSLAEKSTPPFTGLENQGGTCYLNSLVQALFASDALRYAVFRWRYSLEQHGPLADCMPAQLQLLFARLAISGAPATSTVGLTTSFGWSSQEVFVQHDVQELCRVLFDAIERADASGGSEIGTDNAAGVAAPRQVASLAQLVRSCFHGTMRDSLTCATCGRTRSRTDAFADLELTVRTAIAHSEAEAVGAAPTAQPPAPQPPVPLRLEDALATYASSERLEGDNAVSCEACASRQPAVKQLSLVALPAYLMLHLKRFAYDVRGGGYVKLNDPVNVPQHLDMAPLLHDAAAVAAAGGDGTGTSSPPVYQLYAVLMHAGGVSSGHYYALIRHRKARVLEGGSSWQWLCFNDSSVSLVSDEAVALALAPPVPAITGDATSASGSAPRPYHPTGVAPLAKPHFAEDAPVKPEIAVAAAIPTPARAAATELPRNGTPYLLCYARADEFATELSAPPLPEVAAGSLEAASVLPAYAQRLGCGLLPPELLASLLAENAQSARLREAWAARRRLVEVTVTAPALAHASPAAALSCSSDYAGTRPLTLYAPPAATLAQVTAAAHASWRRDLLAQHAASEAAGDAVSAVPLPDVRDVRLRRFDAASRLPRDTFSSPAALAATLESAGLAQALGGSGGGGGSCHLLLEARPPPLTRPAAAGDAAAAAAARETAHPFPWAAHEYDPQAVTLRCYRWSTSLRDRLRRAHAAATAPIPASAEDIEREAATVEVAVGGDADPYYELTLPGAVVATLSVSDLGVRLACLVGETNDAAAAGVAVPVSLQLLTLVRGGMPYTSGGVGGPGAAAAAAPCFLSGLPAEALLLRDAGACSGDALVVEVLGEEEEEAEDVEASNPAAAASPSPAFRLLKGLCSSDALSLYCTLLAPPALALTAQELAGLVGAATPLPALDDGGGGASLQQLSIGAAHTAPAAAPSGTGPDLSGLDPETRAAILAAMAEDTDVVAAGSSSSSQSRSSTLHSRRQAAEGDAAELAFPVRVTARRTDTMGALKARFVEATNEVLRAVLAARRAAAAGAAAASEPPAEETPVLSPPLLLLQAAGVHLRRGPRTPMYRAEAEALRLHDCDLGEGACLLLGWGPPLVGDELELLPVAAIRVASAPVATGGGSSSAVYHVRLPKLKVRAGARVAAMRRLLLSHVRTAVDRLLPALLAAMRGSDPHASSASLNLSLAVPAAAALTPAHLRLRIKNTRPLPVAATGAAAGTAAASAPPVPQLQPGTGAPSLTSYSPLLRDESALRTGLGAVARNAAAAAAAGGMVVSSAEGSGGGSGGGGSTGVDAAEVLVEVLAAPETVGPSDMVLQAREYVPSAAEVAATAAAAAGGVAKAPVATSGSSAAERAAKAKAYGRVARPAAGSGGSCPSSAAASLGAATELVLPQGCTAADLTRLLWAHVCARGGSSAGKGAAESVTAAAAGDSGAARPVLRVARAPSSTAACTAAEAGRLLWYLLPPPPPPHPAYYATDAWRAAVARSAAGDGDFKSLCGPLTLAAVETAAAAVEGAATGVASACAPTPTGGSVTSPPLGLKDGAVLLWRRDPAPVPPALLPAAGAAVAGSSSGAAPTAAAATVSPAAPWAAAKSGNAGGGGGAAVDIRVAAGTSRRGGGGSGIAIRIRERQQQQQPASSSETSTDGGHPASGSSVPDAGEGLS